MCANKCDLSTVPPPDIQPTPRRFQFFIGEDFNVTCTSNVMGAVFTWRAVHIITQQPLILPNTTINISANSSVLVFKPITFRTTASITCKAIFPGNENIFAEESVIVFLETISALM